MRALIYHVATSLDGFIARPDGSTHGFIESGEHVDDYLNQLKDYDATIMGRNTYEYGYQFGLIPGEPAYPHMMHYIISDSLHFAHSHPQVHLIKKENLLQKVDELKNEVGSPIYLCGGGQLAKTLLQHQMIDELIIKLNPILFGSGIHLFDGVCSGFELQPRHRIEYNNGVQMLQFQMNYVEEEVAI